MTTIRKAEAIREVLNELGQSALPREVIACLEERGIRVTPQHVSNEKAKLAKRCAAMEPADLPFAVLKKVRSLVDEVGSANVVRRALDALDELNRTP